MDCLNRYRDRERSSSHSRKKIALETAGGKLLPRPCDRMGETGKKRGGGNAESCTAVKSRALEEELLVDEVDLLSLIM